MKTFILLFVVATAFASADKKTCLEKPDTGMCRGYFPMYYYDAKTQTCQEFIYGGCMGNGNRYGSEEECMENCKDVVAWDSDSVCSVPAETGPCRGYFKRYYFDQVTGGCHMFIYGGCSGNGNNFETADECENNCGKARSAPTACQQEQEAGPCRAFFRRWSFNKDTGVCEMFVYGGCNGNSNNFHSQEECENVCVPRSAPTACQQEQEVGPCRAAFKRWSFNKDTGICEMFVYGGCNGNSNNFHSQEDCEAVCAA